MCSTKINSYTVVWSWDLNTFIDIVNTRLNDGWQPLGGAIVSTDRDGVTEYHQTLVKYK